MTIFDYAHAHPVWTLVYLVLAGVFAVAALEAWRRR